MLQVRVLSLRPKKETVFWSLFCFFNAYVTLMQYSFVSTCLFVSYIHYIIFVAAHTISQKRTEVQRERKTNSFNYLFHDRIDLLKSIPKNAFASLKFITTHSRTFLASSVSGNSLISLSASYGCPALYLNSFIFA